MYHRSCGVAKELLMVAVFSFTLIASTATACTTAVISGRATDDGRPLLWKNRDTPSWAHNEVALFEGGQYKAVAVVNAGDRNSVWMGVNEAGFCIENSLSRDLAVSEKTSGPGNGGLMKRALETCATVDQFRDLLEETNSSGRSTTANFGVIDAEGGAALFETGPREYTIFDANDPEVAPEGYIVRSNFATTAQELAARPTAQQLAAVYSGERYLRACSLLQQRPAGKISLDYVLRNLTRDMADANGRAYPGTINRRDGRLPPVIPTDNTISRTTTVSATVFHGVRRDEDPALTTMWTILGDPKFSIAVPCWVASEEIADALADPEGAELGEIAIALREQSLTSQRRAVSTRGLPGIWDDLWKLEDEILVDTALARKSWCRAGYSAEEITAKHRRIVSKAMAAMEKELHEAEQAPRLLAEELPDIGGQSAADEIADGSSARFATDRDQPQSAAACECGASR